MKDITCLLKLAEDSDWNSLDRSVELTITSGAKTRIGTWRMVSDARDSRMKIDTTRGRWIVHSTDDVWTMYLMPSVDTTVLLELYHVTGDPLAKVTCGSGIGGDGWRQGPPASNVNYSLGFGCA